MTAPRKRGRPGHDQDAVLATAVRLFNERGYDATSMFDIAMALGITKSSVYHHIDGKEHLLQMAIDRALDGLYTAAHEVRDLEEIATCIERVGDGDAAELERALARVDREAGNVELRA